MNLFYFREAALFLSSKPDLFPLRRMVSSGDWLMTAQTCSLRELRVILESVVMVWDSELLELMNLMVIRLISFSNSLGQFRLSLSG